MAAMSKPSLLVVSLCPTEAGLPRLTGGSFPGKLAHPLSSQVAKAEANAAEYALCSQRSHLARSTVVLLKTTVELAGRTYSSLPLYRCVSSLVAQQPIAGPKHTRKRRVGPVQHLVRASGGVDNSDGDVLKEPQCHLPSASSSGTW